MAIGFGEDATPSTKFLPLTFYKMKYIILSIYLTTFNNININNNRVNFKEFISNKIIY